MATGYRREVRNDYPTNGETRRQALSRQYDAYFEKSKPSNNKPKHRRAVPPGCVSIYRVSQWDGRRANYFGIFRSEDEAYRVADDVWSAAFGRPHSQSFIPDRHKIVVEHKAAVELDGQFYITNLDPVRFTEPHPSTVAALLRPATPEELSHDTPVFSA